MEHSVSLVSSMAKKILVLSDGKIVSDGAPQALSASIIRTLEETEDYTNTQGKLAQETSIVPTKVTTNANKLAPKANQKKPSKLVLEEERAKGKVNMILLWDYLKFLGGPTVLFLLITLGVIHQLTVYVASNVDILMFP